MILSKIFVALSAYKNNTVFTTLSITRQSHAQNAPAAPSNIKVKAPVAQMLVLVGVTGLTLLQSSDFHILTCV